MNIGDSALSVGANVLRSDPDVGSSNTPGRHRPDVSASSRRPRAPSSSASWPRDVFNNTDHGPWFDFGASWMARRSCCWLRMLLMCSTRMTVQISGGLEYTFGPQQRVARTRRPGERCQHQADAGAGYVAGSWRFDGGWLNANPQRFLGLQRQLRLLVWQFLAGTKQGHHTGGPVCLSRCVVACVVIALYGRTCPSATTSRVSCPCRPA